MKSLVKAAELSFTAIDEPRLTLTLAMARKDAQKGYQGLQEALSKGKPLEVEVKQHRKKRSLDSNAYLWILCQKIAEVIGSTKEAVYREFIRRVGQFEVTPIKDEAVDRWICNWQAHGLGWVSETVGESKLNGYTNVISYYGSSVYSTKEMSILLDEVVIQCQELGIEVMDPAEIESLKQSWGRQWG